MTSPSWLLAVIECENHGSCHDKHQDAHCHVVSVVVAHFASGCKCAQRAMVETREQRENRLLSHRFCKEIRGLLRVLVDSTASCKQASSWSLNPNRKFASVVQL